MSSQRGWCLCRDGQSEAEKEAEAAEVNILALLRPFLTQQPPGGVKKLLPASESQSAGQQIKLLPSSAVQAEAHNGQAIEGQAVRAYVAANVEAASVHAAGVKLLCALSQQKGQPWLGDTSKQMLNLAAALRLSWKPSGAHSVYKNQAIDLTGIVQMISLSIVVHCNLPHRLLP